MGNCMLPKDDTLPRTSKKDFSTLKTIGRGGFSEVLKVCHLKSGQHYAMKKMLKSRVVSRRSVQSVMNERQLLSCIRHPFIINMHYAFQDSSNLYVVMDLLTGGDLRYHLDTSRCFTEQQAKFFVCCLMLALQYLHANNIIHRDVKPENLVFDKSGYLYLTDFGISRMIQQRNFYDTSGTPGYMAPEVLKREDHGMGVDYYAVGIILHECMLGMIPHQGRNRKQIKQEVFAQQASLKKENTPTGWSAESIDFCNKLILTDQNSRLGANGSKEILNHAWIKEFPWVRLINKTLKAPFIPKTTANLDRKNMRVDWGDQQVLTILKPRVVESLFPGFYFDKYQISKNQDF